jgi:hypothetical protein
MGRRGGGGGKQFPLRTIFFFGGGGVKKILGPFEKKTLEIADYLFFPQAK